MLHRPTHQPTTIFDHHKDDHNDGNNHSNNDPSNDDYDDDDDGFASHSQTDVDRFASHSHILLELSNLTLRLWHLAKHMAVIASECTRTPVTLHSTKADYNLK